MTSQPRQSEIAPGDVMEAANEAKRGGASTIGQHLAQRIGGPGSPGPHSPHRKSHGRYGRGDDRVPCALCDGFGDVVNPGNADPERAITDWLPPVGCPRCSQTGKDPKP